MGHHREARSAPASLASVEPFAWAAPRAVALRFARIALKDGLPCSTAPLPPWPTSTPRSGPAIAAENRRQEEHIELIASENYASPAVMAAQGSQLTNKYAEGYPGQALLRRLRVRRRRRAARHRPRQEAVRRRATPTCSRNSGSQANQAVLFGLLQPGDTIMGMSLAEGGHLTHGMALNMSGKWFKVVSYGLNARRGDRLRRDGAAGPRDTSPS